jgi:hypothetical protein
MAAHNAGSRQMQYEGNSGRRERLISTKVRFMSNAVNEIDDDCDIQEQDQCFDRIPAMETLVDFYRDKRTCDGDGDPFAPAPCEPQTYPLDRKERGVEKAHGSKFPDSVLRNLAYSLDGVIEEGAARIEPKLQDPTFEHGPDVGVDQPESHDARHNESRGLYQLQDGDQME